MRTHCSLFSRAALFSTLFLASSVSYSDTTISTNSSTPLQTSTAGNVTVTNTGNLTTSSTSIAVNDNNRTVTNAGTIKATGDVITINVTGQNATINNKAGSFLIGNTNGGTSRAFDVKPSATGFSLINAGTITTQLFLAVAAPFNNITNSGIIELTGHNGTLFGITAPGTITNNAGGTIRNLSPFSASAIVLNSPNLIMNNAGTISTTKGTNANVVMQNGAVLNNLSTGNIQNSATNSQNVTMSGGATLNNSGTIQNTVGKSVFFPVQHCLL